MPLEARQIYFSYGRKKQWLLENFSITIEPGERLVILGPSGYGKTTLARILSGYEKPKRGEILLHKKPLPQGGVCPIQLIFQHPEYAVNPRWPMKKVLKEGGGIGQEALAVYGIEPDWMERFPGELSGGELQRFCVARALLAKPEYLICDEISTMLDPITQAQIWKVILKENETRGMGVVAITHNEHLARQIGQRIIRL